jgi:hypothetical protein
MRFVVGDKVRIVSQRPEHYNFIDEMEQYLGREYTVRSVEGVHYYLEGLIYSWNEEFIEGFATGEPAPPIMESCTRCGNRHLASELTFIPWSGNLCPNCVENKTFVCSDCGRRAIGDPSRTLCEDCSFYCRDCGTVISREQARSHNSRCEVCFDKPRIHDYNYKPIFTKFGESPDNRFFGLELEIDGGGRDVNKYAQINELFPEQFTYAMYDGSLDNGFEIATQPASLKFLKAIDWNEFARRTKDLGYKADQTATCGLHVHIDLKAFGLTEDAQELTLGRLFYFFSKFQEYIIKFSRRRRMSFDRWARITGVNTVNAVTAVKNLKDSGDKYHALNLSHQGTVEVRIFKGTTNPKKIKATLDFCDALIDIANTCSLQDIQTNEWEYFIENFFQKKSLLTYLKTRGLLEKLPEQVVTAPKPYTVEWMSEEVLSPRCVEIEPPSPFEEFLENEGLIGDFF